MHKNLTTALAFGFKLLALCFELFGKLHAPATVEQGCKCPWAAGYAGFSRPVFGGRSEAEPGVARTEAEGRFSSAYSPKNQLHNMSGANQQSTVVRAAWGMAKIDLQSGKF